MAKKIDGRITNGGARPGSGRKTKVVTIPPKAIGFRLPPEKAKRLAEYTAENKISTQKLLENYIDSLLEKKEKKTAD